MTVKYKQEIVHDYIRTYTGKKFYVHNPRVEDIDIKDIAHSLSRMCRYTGHSRHKFYSVGEHSVMCAHVANMLGYSDELIRMTLLHDASEAYCADLNRPLKQRLDDYKKAEDKIMDVVWEKFDLHPTEEDYKKIKLIDNTLLVHELKQIMFEDDDDIPEVEHIPNIDLNLKPEHSMNTVEQTFLVTFKMFGGKVNESTKFW